MTIPGRIAVFIAFRLWSIQSIHRDTALVRPGKHRRRIRRLLRREVRQ